MWIVPLLICSLRANELARDNIPSNEDPNNQLPTFPYKVWDTQTNDAPSCITRCQQFGFNAAGLEYSSQCCKCSGFRRTRFGPNSTQSAEILKTSMLPLHHQPIPIRLNHNSSLAARSQPRIPTPNATPSALATRTTTVALATDLRTTHGPPPQSNGLSPLETLPESTLC